MSYADEVLADNPDIYLKFDQGVSGFTPGAFTELDLSAAHLVQVDGATIYDVIPGTSQMAIQGGTSSDYPNFILTDFVREAGKTYEMQVDFYYGSTSQLMNAWVFSQSAATDFAYDNDFSGWLTTAGMNHADTEVAHPIYRASFLLGSGVRDGDYVLDETFNDPIQPYVNIEGDTGDAIVAVRVREVGHVTVPDVASPHAGYMFSREAHVFGNFASQPGLAPYDTSSDSSVVMGDAYDTNVWGDYVSSGYGVITNPWGFQPYELGWGWNRTVEVTVKAPEDRPASVNWYSTVVTRWAPQADFNCFLQPDDDDNTWLIARTISPTYNSMPMLGVPIDVTVPHLVTMTWGSVGTDVEFRLYVDGVETSFSTIPIGGVGNILWDSGYLIPQSDYAGVNYGAGGRFGDGVWGINAFNYQPDSGGGLGVDELSITPATLSAARVQERFEAWTLSFAPSLLSGSSNAAAQLQESTDTFIYSSATLEASSGGAASAVDLIPGYYPSATPSGSSSATSGVHRTLSRAGGSPALELATSTGWMAAPADMSLRIMDPAQGRAPTALVVLVAGAFSQGKVDFYYDSISATPVYTLQADLNGEISAVSIPVPETLLKGEHTLYAVSLQAGTLVLRTAHDAFTLNLDPATGHVVGPDVDPIEIPEAFDPASEARRWVLQDLMPGGLGSYVMPHNPTVSTRPAYSRNLSAKRATANAGQHHIYEAANASYEWTFEGTCLSQDEQEKLYAFLALNRRFYLIDHWNHAWVVAFQNVDIKPHLRQTLLQGGTVKSTDWIADYTVTATVYERTWRTPVTL